MGHAYSTISPFLQDPVAEFTRVLSSENPYPLIAILVSTLLLSVYVLRYNLGLAKKVNIFEADDREFPDTVVLYQLPRPPTKGYPNFSGPCAKLETYLRMTGVQYTTKLTIPNTGPYKKVPYIRVKGETVPDSQLCIWHLQKLQLPGYHDIDAHLTTNEKAIVESVRVLLEETIYRQFVYERWANPKNAKATRQIMLSDLPFPMRNIIFYFASQQNKNDLIAHGFGRYNKSQQLMFCRKAVDSVSDLLGEKQYMLGRRYCSLDAIAYAHLAHVLYAGDEWPDVPLSLYLKSKTNLVRYIERMTEEFYPELAITDQSS
ncbi:hypothetical protein HK098_007470 [Nowakowskiella sp. JEL0407]|nr:hypothetical protein HK098_007470 [Nowakowskiella sp. JEL0407]